MNENKKPFAPINTGIIEGIGWGVITDLSIQAVTVATIATIGIATGTTTIAAMAASPLIIGVAAVGATAAGIGGVVNGIKTIMEKRNEWEEAHSQVFSGSVESKGKISEQDLSVKR